MNKLKIILIFVFIGTISVIGGAYFKMSSTTSHENFETKIFYNSITKNINNENVALSKFKGKWLLINFWATWCAPCKEEMPSLDMLIKNKDLNNLMVFPINIGKDGTEKAIEFYKELKIKNLNLYFDSPITLAKTFGLRGIPTSILFNKNGEEFARIIGSIDFQDKKFTEWLSKYN